MIVADATRFVCVCIAGGCRYPLVSDLAKKISTDYGVLINEGPDAGVTLRWVDSNHLPHLHAKNIK
jgi:hypothetical protein